MKKLMSLFAAMLFVCTVFACNVPDGYTQRQEVAVYYSNENYRCGAMVYQATNMCDAYCICFLESIYS